MNSNPKPCWPMHSSQADDIEKILAAGGTVKLAYVATPKPDAELSTLKNQVQLEGKQRL